jgi:hypothetical protein
MSTRNVSSCVGQECRICQSASNHQIYQVQEMMFGTREVFDYFLCSNCGCLQIAIVPNELGRFYPSNYYSLGSDTPNGVNPEKQFGKRFLQRLLINNALFGRGYKLSKIAGYFVDMPREWHEIAELLKACSVRNRRASFLDIGCGSHSWWLRSLDSIGFKNLTGVDPNIANDLIDGNIRVFKSSADDINGKFDVITLHHSLEHIQDQFGALCSARDHMAPKGFLVVRIPTVSSMVWEQYKEDWVELDAPRHLYLHSLNSFELLSKRVGLRIQEIIWDSGPFQFYGSEQYRRGIPLMADNSYWKNPSCSSFTYKEMSEFSAKAVTANREERGGRVCFILRRLID